MREIKFRFWCNRRQEFFCKDYRLGVEYYERDFEDGIFQQYTGLKDKNGKEIYEGDIVAYTFYNGTAGSSGEVYWGKYSDAEYVDNLQCWMVKTRNGSSPLSSLINDAGFGCSYFMSIDKNSVEVVGNIFERTDK